MPSTIDESYTDEFGTKFYHEEYRGWFWANNGNGAAVGPYPELWEAEDSCRCNSVN